MGETRKNALRLDFDRTPSANGAIFHGLTQYLNRPPLPPGEWWSVKAILTAMIRVSQSETKVPSVAVRLTDRHSMASPGFRFPELRISPLYVLSTIVSGFTLPKVYYDHQCSISIVNSSRLVCLEGSRRCWSRSSGLPPYENRKCLCYGLET